MRRRLMPDTAATLRRWRIAMSMSISQTPPMRAMPVFFTAPIVGANIRAFIRALPMPARRQRAATMRFSAQSRR